VLVVALLGGANLAYLEWRLSEEMEQEVEAGALMLGRYLAAESVDLILYQDLVGLHEFLHRNSGGRRAAVSYALILDPSGRVLAHTFPVRVPHALLASAGGTTQRPASFRRVVLGDEVHQEIALPIHGGELGMLRLAVPEARIHERMLAIRRDLLLMAVVVMVLAAVGAYSFTYSSLKPFDRIVGALERFDPGRHREEIGIHRADEIGELGAKVDEVTARLHDTQASLVRTEKMASVGVIAAGVAHEINNPISGIANCLRRIRERPDDARQTREYVELMLAASDHVGSVVSGLLDFARTRQAEERPLDLRSVVTRAQDLIGFRLEQRRLRLTWTTPEVAVTVRGDAAQLTQVLVNVLLNAVDATPEGGGIDVELQRGASEATLRVSDSGDGISALDVARVFEPFFTTKDPGHGTGLGLAVTHRIVMDHGGCINLCSDDGVGTDVVIRLPLEAEATA